METHYFTPFLGSPGCDPGLARSALPSQLRPPHPVVGILPLRFTRFQQHCLLSVSLNSFFSPSPLYSQCRTEHLISTLCTSNPSPSIHPSIPPAILLCKEPTRVVNVSSRSFVWSRFLFYPPPAATTADTNNILLHLSEATPRVVRAVSQHRAVLAGGPARSPRSSDNNNNCSSSKTSVLLLSYQPAAAC